MLGYDWPRLHAALNDLPAALLLVAVLFDLIGLAASRPGAPGGRLLDADRRRGRRRAGRPVRAPGRGAHRPRRGGPPGDGDARGAGPHHPRHLRGAWRCGGSCGSAGWGARSAAWSLVASLVGLGMLLATASFGGKLVFDHAAGIPTEVLQAEMQERAEGHHHGAADADDHDHAAPATAADSGSAPGYGSAGDSANPAGHTHAPGTPPHKD